MFGRTKSIKQIRNKKLKAMNSRQLISISMNKSININQINSYIKFKIFKYKNLFLNNHKPFKSRKLLKIKNQQRKLKPNQSQNLLK